jgi:hypothetical protein
MLSDGDRPEITVASAVALPPFPQRFQDWTQALPFIGKMVLNSRWVIAIKAARDQSVLFHGFQAGR